MRESSQESQSRGPAREIVGDITAENIVEGSCTRRTTEKARKQAYFADLQHPDELPGYYAAFAVGLVHGRKRLYRDELPLLPRTWKGMLKHTHKASFEAAMTKEY